MADTVKGKTKKIIMDKAPSGDNLDMKAQMGFQAGSYGDLTNALNTEFNISLTEAEVEAQQRVIDVVNLVESKLP